jgi:hypothetical protein
MNIARSGKKPLDLSDCADNTNLEEEFLPNSNILEWVDTTELEEVLTTSIYEKEYMCENSAYFDETVLKTIRKEDDNAIFEYIKKGTIQDVCVGQHNGNGNIVVVHLLKAVVLSGNVEIMKKILELYPEYIAYYDHEYSLLSYAIINNKLDIVYYLIDIGIDTNIRGSRGRTALYYAINTENYKLFEKLLEAGADPNLEYAVPRFNMLYHCLVDCYYYTTNKEHKKMCIELLKRSTVIQTEHYSKYQLKLLKQLQDECC